MQLYNKRVESSGFISIIGLAVDLKDSFCEHGSIAALDQPPGNQWLPLSELR
jgi:hypothetical protein